MGIIELDEFFYTTPPTYNSINQSINQSRNQSINQQASCDNYKTEFSTDY